MTRTQLIEPEDLPNVQKMQQEYKLEPLSAYLGEETPGAAPAIQWKPWEEGAETTDEFWAYVNFLLPLTTPNPQDKPVQDRMAKIGLMAGKPWDSAALGEDVSTAIAAGMQDALAELKDASTKITDPSLFFRSRKDLNKDYFNRYSIGSSTPGLNTAADGSITIYFQAKSPGKDKESNWLPAPEGPFWPILRTYGPGQSILHGSWKLPQVRQADLASHGGGGK